MDSNASVPDQLTMAAELVVAPSRRRLHLRSCSHLQDSSRALLVEASPQDRIDIPVCSECDAEIHGVGRQRFSSLEEAFEAFPLPLENRARMREIASHLTYNDVWIPNGRSYVAVGIKGQAAAAYFAPGYVDVHVEPAGYRREELPTYVAGGAGVAGRMVRRQAVRCARCNIELPATGRCDECD
jgi:hypothetical protein